MAHCVSNRKDTGSLASSTHTSDTLPNVDYEAFSREIYAIRDEANASLDDADRRHLFRVIWVNRLCTFLGYLTAWIVPNPISAYLISQGLFGRWMVMHHIGHGGYDKVPGMPHHMHSKRYAIGGWRRVRDWFDWMLPEAWNYEHNILHHYFTSENKDPDLVEDHAAFMRGRRVPKFIKYLIVAFISVTWKFTYYAPNTLRAMEEKGRNEPDANVAAMIWNNVFDLRLARVRALWFRCYLPYGLVAFVILPLLFLPLGKWAVFCVLVNRLLAELMTNFHTFMVVAPNHAGDDLYRFPQHFRNRHEYCINQVISSCNYACGNDRVDYMQGWLNYQIEHHLYPALPMRKYQTIQPRIREVCLRHGVPYIQQSIGRRFGKLVDIMVGNSSMMWLPAPDATHAAAAEAARRAAVRATDDDDDRDAVLDAELA